MVSALILAFAGLASAHTAAFAPGMYCRGGAKDGLNNNSNDPVNPLWNLTKADWWFQHDRGCDARPPPAGEFLELPAGGSVTVELAHNQAFTTLSYNGQFVTDWPDGQNHPEDYNAITDPGPQAGCLSDGALHASDRASTAGTAFAIAYESDLSKIAMEDLVVFTTLEHTPWKRLATYEVPAALPACPPGGCTCAWLWVPYLCGQSNMYMQGFKCNVTGVMSTVPLAKAKPPVLCKDDPSTCVKGAKQMIASYQLEGNNIETQWPTTPMYNTDCGWQTGAQNDIFASDVSSGALESSSFSSSSTTTISTIASSPSAATTTSVAIVETSSAQPTSAAPTTFVTSIKPSFSSSQTSSTTVDASIPETTTSEEGDDVCEVEE